MALTVTYDQDGPGAGRYSGLIGNGFRKIVTGVIAFDNSYPTGGEDISGVTDQFRTCKGMIVESPLTSAGTGKHAVVDLTTEKVLLYTNAAAPAEVADTSDQSGATGLSFIAWGI